MPATKKSARKKSRPAAKVDAQDPRWTFSSMKQLSTALGIPVSVLSWAKAEGCPAFEAGQSRVFLDKLLPWLMSRMQRITDGSREESLDDIEKRLQKAKADNEELKFLEDSKQLIRLDQAIEMLCEPVEIIRQELQVMPATQAALVNPSDPVFAREALEEWRRQAMKSMDDRLDQLDPMRFSDEAKQEGSDADS